MATLDATFGTYSFGDELETLEIENSARINPIPVPRREGFLADRAYNEGMRIRIGGLLIYDTADNTRSALNNLKNALNGGKQLFRLYNDREVLCQKSFFTYRYQEGNLKAIEWEAELISEESGFKDVSETQTTKTITASPQTDTFDNGGNVDTPVVIRITAGSNDIASGLRIDNLTTGEYFTINEAITAGDYIDIDTDLLTVVNNSGTNKIGVFAQDFFKLAAGTNSIKWTGTATGSPTIRLTYKPRYDGI